MTHVSFCMILNYKTVFEDLELYCVTVYIFASLFCCCEIDFAGQKNSIKKSVVENLTEVPYEPSYEPQKLYSL